ncbi:MAG: Jag N-terminal domain-containing protein, partial [Firmicutes bacterium]|nr:Jag N-terminal domain-containing protein [Bacillota bacterium]
MKKMIVEMTGKTVNEAVDAALAELEATIDEVDIEILQEPSSGFLGLGKKPAKVVVKMIGYEPEEEKEEEKTEVKAEIKKEEVKEEIKKEETVQKEEVKEEEKQSRPQRTTDPIVTAEKFLKEVFDSMNIEAEMESELVDNKQLKINIKGNEMG